MTRHALRERATKEQLAAATEAADWLLDAIATATQNRRYLRGDESYDDVSGEAILLNGEIACLRAMIGLTK